MAQLPFEFLHKFSLIFLWFFLKQIKQNGLPLRQSQVKGFDSEKELTSDILTRRINFSV